MAPLVKVDIPVHVSSPLLLAAMARLLLLLVVATTLAVGAYARETDYYCEGQPPPEVQGCVYCYCIQPDLCEYELRAPGSSCWIRNSRGECSKGGICVPDWIAPWYEDGSFPSPSRDYASRDYFSLMSIPAPTVDQVMVEITIGPAEPENENI